MYESLRNQILDLLKVPPAPRPPMGDPASLKVFRAGRNYYKLRMTSWTIAQLFASEEAKEAMTAFLSRKK